MYYVGIDGGGTKTKLSILNHNKELLVSEIFDGININSSPILSVENELEKIYYFIKEKTSEFQNCGGICFGVAGVSNPMVKEIFTKKFRELGYIGEIIIVGDHQAALMGALNGEDGVILISGTGSVCLGTSKGISHRSGGFGHIVDDGGSGYRIGRDILSNVLMASDGRSKTTALTPLVFDYLGITSIEELIKFIYSAETSKKEIAAIAPLLIKALELNDKVAFDIAEDASSELFSLVVATVEKLKMKQGKISFLGGILTAYKAIKESLINKINTSYPELMIVDAYMDAAYGSGLIAMEDISFK